MVKAYCVAGHTFHLEMPDNQITWGLLSQYDPFEVPAVADPLFRLSLVNDIPQTDETPLMIEDPEEEGASKIHLYDAGEYIKAYLAPTLHAPVCAVLLIGKDMKEARLKISESSRPLSLFSINNSLMLMFAFATSDKMTLEMHSSVIVNGGKGYMFLGKSGTGKSTHSGLWLKYIPGSELLNDDNPVIRIDGNGCARVYGSPWSGKTPCYRNMDVPVGAIVRIVRAGNNAVSRYGILESYTSVYSSCSGLKSDRKMSDDLHRTLEKVALSVPCYKLECLPDKDAALLCYSTVKD